MFQHLLPSSGLRPRPVKRGARGVRWSGPAAFGPLPKKVLLFASDSVPRGPETCEPGEGGFQSCTIQECLFPGVKRRTEYNINYCYNSKPVFETICSEGVRELFSPEFQGGQKKKKDTGLLVKL